MSNTYTSRLNEETYQGQPAFGAWNNRAVTRRMKRVDATSERARFNNKPAPQGTLPAVTPVMAVKVVSGA